jgi:hypothetical protein
VRAMCRVMIDDNHDLGDCAAAHPFALSGSKMSPRAARSLGLADRHRDLHNLRRSALPLAKRMTTAPSLHYYRLSNRARCCSLIVDLTPTGSGRSPAGAARWRKVRENPIAANRSASAPPAITFHAGKFGECLFHQTKQCRCIAMRHGMLAVNDFAFTQHASIRLELHAHESPR